MRRSRGARAGLGVASTALLALALVVGLLAPSAATASATPTVPAGGDATTSATNDVVTEVSSGTRSTCAVTAGNKVLCWGFNAHGALGNGTTDDVKTPVQVTTAGTPLAGKAIAHVSVADEHACAVTTDGIGACWGVGVYGQLGTGSSVSKLIPTAIKTVGTPLEGKAIETISAGYGGGCALTTDHLLACWGDGGSGQLGNGTTTNSSSPVAVTTAGTPLDGKTIDQVSVGTYHACAHTTDGVVACWGWGPSGNLGNGGTANSSVPVAVTPLAGKTFTSVSAGDWHSCATTSDGGAACWGLGQSGELGDGIATPSHSATTPVAVSKTGPLSGKAIAEIEAGTVTTCARTTDDVLACWGDGRNGIRGGANTIVSGSATQVPVTGTSLAGADIVALTARGDSACVRTATGAVFCWGSNAYGQVGDGTGGIAYKPVPAVVGSLTGQAITEVATGYQFGCARTNDGIVSCWGDNQRGQLGRGSTVEGPLPVALSTSGTPLAGAFVSQLSAANNTACATTSTGVAACWGSGGSGTLGDGVSHDATKPVAVKTTGTALDGKLVRFVRVIHTHACAVTTDEVIACWGSNFNNQLGDGSTTQRTQPVATAVAGTPLAGKEIIDLAGGQDHTCALTKDSIIACWGDNGFGQLGTGNTTDHATPTLVPLTGTPLDGKVITQLTGGGYHECAKANDGTTACWGFNGYGQLGTGTKTNASSPTAVKTNVAALAGKTIATVAGGPYRTCFTLTDGGAACAGQNDRGGNAMGSTLDDTPNATAVAVSGTSLSGKSIVQIDPGGPFGCARASDGTASCWGFNAYGQWGTGENAYPDQPVLILGDIATPATVPGAPTGVSAVAGNTTADVSWTAPTSDGGSAVTGYVVTPYQDGVAKTPVASAGTGTTKAIFALTNGKAYTFTVAATNAVGTGPESSPSSPVTPVSPTTKPNAPTNVTAVAGNAKATVSWTAPANNGGPAITSYVITPSIGGVAQTPIPSSGTGTTKEITDLTNGTAYTFTVAAVNSAGTGASSTSSAAVTPATVPGAPTAVSAVRGDTKATVTWTAPADDGGSAVTSYVITPSIGGVAQSPIPSSGTGTTKEITGLANGTAYTFTVAAVNGVGTGASSTASAAVTPQPGFFPFASWADLVTRQYVDLTTKPPSTLDRDLWVTSLATGAKTKGDLVDALRRGTENTTNVDPVVRLYRSFLGRTPDAGGLRFWVGRRRAGTWTLTRTADSFASSSEFKTKYGTLTNRQFVTRIYTDVLGRPADTSGVDYWTRKLDTKAKTRGGVMVGFSESSEYKRKQAENTDVTVASIFLLGRAPTEPEVSAWTTRQKAGTTNAVLATELLDSAAYATHIG